MTGHSVTSDDWSEDDSVSCRRTFCSFVAPTFFCLGASVILVWMFVVCLSIGLITTIQSRSENNYAIQSAKSDANSVFDEALYLMDKFQQEIAESNKSYQNTAMTFISKKLQKLEDTYNRNGSYAVKHYELHNVSGCSTQKAGSNKPGLTVCYRNIRHMVAKILTFKTDASNILLNCRIDELPNGKGAKDNIAACAIMLVAMKEVLKTEIPLNRNLIFLFNGGEEYGLLGPHGVMKQEIEPNEGNISSIINLNNCGDNGWNISYHPSSVELIQPGNVIAEELYKSGLFYRNADYTTLRMDDGFRETKFDFNDKCHVYQTGIHRSDYLAAERIKREGDALFKLLMNAAADTMPSSVGMVYFDVFGWKMIHLDVSTASVIGYAITAASVFSMLIVTLTVDSDVAILGKFFTCFALVVTSYTLAALIAIGISQLLNYFNLNMLWYSPGREWLVIFIYVVPSFIGMTSPYALYNCLRSNLGKKKRSEMVMFMIAVQFTWTLILLCGALLKIRSSYLLAIGLIPVIINNIFWGIVSCRRQICAHLCIALCQFVYVGCLGGYLYYVAGGLYQSFIKASGTSGPAIDSELIVALLTALTSVLIYCYYAPLVVLLRKPSQLWYIFILLLIGSGIIVGFTSNKNPFSSRQQQHFRVLHVERKLYQYKTHVRFVCFDYIMYPENRRGAAAINELLTKDIVTSIKDSCSYNLYCGVPGPHQEHAYRLRTEDDTPTVIRPKLVHNISQPYHCNQYYTENATLMSECNTVSTGGAGKSNDDYVLRNITFTYEGTADRVTFAISPEEQIALTKWNLTTDDPIKYIPWNKRNVYYFIYQGGNSRERLFTFQITLQIPKWYNNDKLVKLSMTSEFTSSANFTPNFKQFLNSLPDWIKTSAWTAIYEEEEISAPTS